MTNAERGAVVALAGVFGLRMFGLFAILPVAALYAVTLQGQSPVTVGLALGAYGVTQALLQIPFGMLSDRLGRKPVIVAGLLIFAAGSVMAAMADHILWLIAGRALQGAGAIAAAVMALTADLTREEQRTKAMAMIGITIGLSFMLALIAGPFLAGNVGVPALFWLTALLACMAIGLLLWRVPDPVRPTRHCDVQTVPEQLSSILRNAQLWRLDLGIFVLHLVLAATFVAVPMALVHSAELPLADHWQVYLPVMVLSVGAVWPLMAVSARTALVPRVFVAAVSIVLVSQVVLWVFSGSLWGLAVGLWVFFWGFNVLEAVLPSLVSRVAPPAGKGTAIGVYNGCQFLGIFCGGLLGGWLYGSYGEAGVFAATCTVAVLWLGVVLTAPIPRLFHTELLRVTAHDAEAAGDLAKRLAKVPGVMEAVVIAEEGVAYLKVDREVLDEHRLREFAS